MIDFPASPTVGQLFYASNSAAYQWNGVLWDAVGGVTSPSPGGDFQAFSSNAGSSTSIINQIFPTVITGNSGGWYSTSTGRFTPPAGRYRLSTLTWCYSSGSNINAQIWITKNGTPVTANAPSANSAAANLYIEASYECIVDANGTDWFNVQTQTSVAASLSFAMFNAFPISGIKGPMGDLPSGLKLADENILGSAANTLAITFPANARKVEVEFSYFITGGTNVLSSLQYMQSGVPLASGYGLQALYGATSSAAAASSSGATSVGVLTGLSSSGKVSLFRCDATTTHAICENFGVATANFLMQATGSSNNVAFSTVTGIRLTIPSDTFRAGSWMRSYVVL